MRIRNTDYWTGQIQAEKSFPPKLKLPKNAQEEQNYKIAEYFLMNSKPDTTRLKLVA